MSERGIYLIVEGDGDRAALPALVRRIAHEKLGVFDFEVLEPYRLARTLFAKDDEVERVLRLASIKLERFTTRRIIVVMDADDDCPGEATERIRDLAGRNAIPATVALAMPCREYEAFFIGCLDRNRPHADFREDWQQAMEPDGIRDAKGWFKSNVLRPGRRYSPSVDQVRYTHAIDLGSTASRSFVKLRKEIEAALMV